MNIETFFSEEDIEDIYKTVIIYSILKYKTLSEDWQILFQSRYQKALYYQEKLNIEPVQLEHETLKILFKKLENYQIMYQNILEQNKPIIDLYAPNIEKIILKTIRKKSSELERISFLYDFLTNYITYSESYFNLCLQVPPIDNFTFDFKKNVPVDTSINGLLVMGQGLCDDIANLLIYLGKKLNLKIEKIFATYQENSHSLNIITLENGNNYLIDTTRCIRKDKSKKDSFLVSESDLNQGNQYQFHHEMPPTTTYQRKIPNFEKEVQQLISSLNYQRPQIINLSTNTTLKLSR